MTLDVFRTNPDAFSQRELTEAIRVMPIQYGDITQMGIFQEMPLAISQFQVEAYEGTLRLLEITQPGGPRPGRDPGKRAMRNFSTLHMPEEGRITAKDVEGIRQYGEEMQLQMIEDKVEEELRGMKANSDISIEYLQAGALQGLVRDRDGNVISDLYNDFGVARNEINFTFGTPGAIDAKVEQVKNAVEDGLLGDVSTGVHALCSPEFWEKLIANEEIKRAYDFWMQPNNPQRADVRKGIEWKGIVWQQYRARANVPQEDGTSVTRRFIPEGDATFFPVGTLSTFRLYHSPPLFMDTVNQTSPGVYHARMAPDQKYNEYVEFLSQTNVMPICLRPSSLVRGHSSN